MTTASPALMPRRSAPVRTVNRPVAADLQHRWCGDRTCEVCDPWSDPMPIVEVVRVIRPLGKRNPAMADALRRAGRSLGR